MRRSLAICNLSFSISSALYCTESSATFNSLWQARAKASSSAGSVGGSAVASDMPKLYWSPSQSGGKMRLTELRSV